MPEKPDHRVSPAEIAKIIEAAAKEPGVNDMLSLLRLSQEANEIEQFFNSLRPTEIMTQASSTAGWILKYSNSYEAQQEDQRRLAAAIEAIEQGPDKR